MGEKKPLPTAGEIIVLRDRAAHANPDYLSGFKSFTEYVRYIADLAHAATGKEGEAYRETGDIRDVAPATEAQAKEYAGLVAEAREFAASGEDSAIVPLVWYMRLGYEPGEAAALYEQGISPAIAEAAMNGSLQKMIDAGPQVARVSRYLQDAK